MRTVKVIKGGLFAAMALGASAVSAQGRPAPTSPGPEVFISPMGEPFRGESQSAQLRAWFDRADANRNGAISIAEMRGDAERFYGTLNTNRDREIDPSELRVYEEQIAPEIRVGPGSQGIVSGTMRRRPTALSSQFSKTGEAQAPLERDVVRRGAGLFGLLGVPNPVASADTNLNRGISPEEFARVAGDRFLLLDANKDGQLRFDELPSLPARNVGRRR